MMVFSCVHRCRYGFAITGHVVNVLGVLYGLFMCIPELWSQPVSSFFFAFYRALLFSFVAAFTAVVFGPKAVGWITGILYTTTAFFILLQTPMVNFTMNQVCGDHVAQAGGACCRYCASCCHLSRSCGDVRERCLRCCCLDAAER